MHQLEAKKLLREKFLRERSNSSKLNYISETSIIIDQIVNLLISFNAQYDDLVIGTYIALPGEINLVNLFGKIPNLFTAPKVKQNQMYFVNYKPGDLLEASQFKKLKQPNSDMIMAPDIVIIPALALSITGTRLGYGSGFYDKYFSKKSTEREVTKIGVCLHRYLLAFLPKEVHDLNLNYIITEKIIIKL